MRGPVFWQLVSALAFVTAAGAPTVHAQEEASQPPEATGAESVSEEASGPPPAEQSAPTTATQSEAQPLETIPVETTEAQPSADEATALDDIVVTAGKRSELSRQVGSAVTAMSGSQLDKIHASSFQDFATYIPGLSFYSEGMGRNQVVLRGVTSGPETGATVGLYVDEVPVGSSTGFAGGSNALDFEAYDLDRIEVLRGPQGTLYGASTLGGLLKYATRAPDGSYFDPTFQLEGSETAEGERNFALRGAAGIPLFGDGALRVTGYSVNDAGFIDDPGRGVENGNRARKDGGRAQILWSITPGIDVRLSGLKQVLHRGEWGVADRNAETREPTAGVYEQQYDFAQPFDQDIDLYSGVLDWDLPWAALTSVTGWQDLYTFYVFDTTRAVSGALGLPPGSQIRNYAELPVTTKKLTQELRLTSAGVQPFGWQFGLFYADEKSDEGVYLYAPELGPGPFLFDGTIPTHYTEMAAFGNGTYYFTEALDLTLGLRYSRDRNQYSQHFRGTLGNPQDPNTYTNVSEDHREDVLNYLINPRYRWTGNLMLYGRAASSYRPGGPNFVILDAAGQPQGDYTFKPDSVWNYELGAKLDFLGGRAFVDFDVYHIDWKDMQISISSGGQNQLANAGDATIEGAETSGSVRLLSSLVLGGSASYTDARLAEDAPKMDADSGQRLPMSPRYNAAATIDYGFPFFGPFDANAGLSYRFVGNRAAGFEGSTVRPNYRLEEYGLLDLRIDLRSSRFGIALYAKNVLNEPAELSAWMTDYQFDKSAPARAGLAQPRTIGFVLDVSNLIN